MRNIKLILEYDGTNYFGYQRQKNVITVQSVLEDALKELTNERIKTYAASRTDRGAHALHQVVNFKTNANNIPAEKFSYALNPLLPKDIVCLHSEEVPLNFHARYSAISKVYYYLILNKAKSALYRNYAFVFKEKLDLQKMQQAATYLTGVNDYTSFKCAGSYTKNNICEVKYISIIEDAKFVKIEIEANRFLYGMIRSIVSVLILVGINKIDEQEVKNILLKKDRSLIKFNVPASGLYLYKVNY